MQAIIYHNPRCSKSRQTLQLLKDKGIEPTIIEYLTNPPTIETLSKIITNLGVNPRAIIRKKEAAYNDNNLANKSLSDDEIIELMVKNPVLIERPIVTIDGKAVIGRPPENVLDII